MYVRVHACSKQYRACNHPLALLPATLSTSATPPPLCLLPSTIPPPSAPRVLFLALSSPTCSLASALTTSSTPSTTSPFLPTFSGPCLTPAPLPRAFFSCPSSSSSSFLPIVPFRPPFASLPLPLPLLFALFSVASYFQPRAPCFHPGHDARPVAPSHPRIRECRAGLKENAIIRRTSTNELIVGASRYRHTAGTLFHVARSNEIITRDAGVVCALACIRTHTRTYVHTGGRVNGALPCERGRNTRARKVIRRE